MTVLQPQSLEKKEHQPTSSHIHISFFGAYCTISIAMIVHTTIVLAVLPCMVWLSSSWLGDCSILSSWRKDMSVKDRGCQEHTPRFVLATCPKVEPRRGLRERFRSFVLGVGSSSLKPYHRSMLKSLGHGIFLALTETHLSLLTFLCIACIMYHTECWTLCAGFGLKAGVNEPAATEPDTMESQGASLNTSSIPK